MITQYDMMSEVIGSILIAAAPRAGAARLKRGLVTMCRREGWRRRGSGGYSRSITDQVGVVISRKFVHEDHKDYAVDYSTDDEEVAQYLSIREAPSCPSGLNDNRSLSAKS